MSELSVAIDFEEVARKLSALRSGQLEKAVADGLRESLKDLARAIRQKMSGERLRVRTGRMRRRIRTTPVQVSSALVRGEVGARSGPVKALEGGLDRVVLVGAHSRYLKKSGRAFPVRPFKRHMKLTARRFIAAALQEGKTGIEERQMRALLALVEGA